MTQNNTPATASSKTYRKVINKLAKVLRVKPNHSEFPSEDFQNMADLVDEKSKKRPMRWYRRGIRRGFEEPCDAILNKSLELKKGTLYCPNDLVISVRVKFRGEEWQDKEFTFTANELGFK
jgi:hypothetical protein